MQAGLISNAVLSGPVRSPFSFAANHVFRNRQGAGVGTAGVSRGGIGIVPVGDDGVKITANRYAGATNQHSFELMQGSTRWASIGMMGLQGGSNAVTIQAGSGPSAGGTAALVTAGSNDWGMLYLQGLEIIRCMGSAAVFQAAIPYYFIASGLSYSQYWDYTNARIGFGHNAPASGTQLHGVAKSASTTFLRIQEAATPTVSPLEFHTSGSVQTLSVGPGGKFISVQESTNTFVHLMALASGAYSDRPGWGFAKSVSGTTAPSAFMATLFPMGDGVSNKALLCLGNGTYSSTVEFMRGATPGTGAIRGCSGSGTNIAGANLEIAAGQGTGSATPALLKIQATAAEASGATNQTLVDVLTVTNSLLLTHGDGVNKAYGTTTGTKLGTATSQKLGLWNTTPIVQPTTGVAAASFTANSGTAVNDASTFDGYTMGQVVKALRNFGMLA